MDVVTVRRGRPTADDSRQKLENVVSVAREMFSELGYRAVTMRDVADRARVSTRTLYNRFADKLSLFTACIDFGAAIFPLLDPAAGEDLEEVLRRHAAEIVRALSRETSLQLGMLVYREGGEFPEMLQAAEANQDRFLVKPLAAFLRTVGLEKPGSTEMAKLFMAMAISDWQRSITFRHPMPTEPEIERHARQVAAIFLRGARAAEQNL
jgi:TetR/AcrR family transcriptional regulator, mexJK operon transcriptional repressor